MKRDWDLLRAIILVVESEEGSGIITVETVQQITGEDDADKVRHHMDLALQSPYLTGPSHTGYIKEINHPGTIGFLPALTWQGREFLEHVRRDDIWARVKLLHEAAGLGMTYLSVRDISCMVRDTRLRDAMNV